MRSEEEARKELIRLEGIANTVNKNSGYGAYIIGKVDSFKWMLACESQPKPSETMNIFIESLEALDKRVEALEGKKKKEYSYTVSQRKSGTGIVTRTFGIQAAESYKDATQKIFETFENGRDVEILKLEKLK